MFHVLNLLNFVTFSTDNLMPCLNLSSEVNVLKFNQMCMIQSVSDLVRVAKESELKHPQNVLSLKWKKKKSTVFKKWIQSVLCYKMDAGWNALQSKELTSQLNEVEYKPSGIFLYDNVFTAFCLYITGLNWYIYTKHIRLTNASAFYKEAKNDRLNKCNRSSCNNDAISNVSGIKRKADFISLISFLSTFARHHIKLCHKYLLDFFI